MYSIVYTSLFLISSYGAPLAQRTSYLALHSSLFGPDDAVNYDYSVTNSINSLLIVSNTMGHTLTIVEPMCPMLQNISKALIMHGTHSYQQFYLFASGSNAKWSCC